MLLATSSSSLPIFWDDDDVYIVARKASFFVVVCLIKKNPAPFSHMWKKKRTHTSPQVKKGTVHESISSPLACLAYDYLLNARRWGGPQLLCLLQGFRFSHAWLLFFVFVVAAAWRRNKSLWLLPRHSGARPGDAGRGTLFGALAFSGGNGGEEEMKHVSGLDEAFIGVISEQGLCNTHSAFSLRDAALIEVSLLRLLEPWQVACNKPRAGHRPNQCTSMGFYPISRGGFLWRF